MENLKNTLVIIEDDLVSTQEYILRLTVKEAINNYINAYPDSINGLRENIIFYKGKIISFIPVEEENLDTTSMYKITRGLNLLGVVPGKTAFHAIQSIMPNYRNDIVQNRNTFLKAEKLN